MTQDQQRRAANLWIASRGELSKRQCEQLAKEMSVKQVLIDRIAGGIRSVLLAVVIGLAGALVLGNWSVCEQDSRLCAFTGSEA